MKNIIPEFSPNEIATKDFTKHVYSGNEIEILANTTNVDILSEVCQLVDTEVKTSNELTYEREHDGAPYEFASDYHIPDYLVDEAYQIAQDQIDSGVPVNSFNKIKLKYNL